MYTLLHKVLNNTAVCAFYIGRQQEVGGAGCTHLLYDSISAGNAIITKINTTLHI